MIKKTVKADLYGKMAMFTMGIGKMVKRREKEHSHLPMETNIQAIFLRITFMAMVK